MIDSKQVRINNSLSPRSRAIEHNLNILNQTSTQINELENKLHYFRKVYTSTLNENIGKLKKLSTKLGKCVVNSRPYHEKKQRLEVLLRDIQNAAETFDHASSHANSARDNLASFEEHLFSAQVKTPDALERLNSLVAEFNEAKCEVDRSKADHEKLLEVYAVEEKSMRELEQRNRFDIKRSKPYFDMYNRFTASMHEAKLQVQLCSQKIMACKSAYANAMTELERISNSVHNVRQYASTTPISSIQKSSDHPDSYLVNPETSNDKSNLSMSANDVSNSSTEPCYSHKLGRSQSQPNSLLNLEDLLESVNQANRELNVFRTSKLLSAFSSDSVSQDSGGNSTYSFDKANSLSGSWSSASRSSFDISECELFSELTLGSSSSLGKQDNCASEKLKPVSELTSDITA